MQLLSSEAIQYVSGGTTPSKIDYDYSANFGGFVGLYTAAASISLLPTPYNEQFAIRLVIVGLGFLAGYTVGAIGYYVSNTVKSSLDYYLAPEQ